ncbi:hypothetical protein ACLOJK_015019 [Asimina triloba]
MDMKKITCFVLVAALFISAVVAAPDEAAHAAAHGAHEEKKLAPAASAPEAAGADAPDAAAGPASDAVAAGGPASAGVVAGPGGAAGAPGPSTSGANAFAPVLGLIGVSLLSLVAFYLQ